MFKKKIFQNLKQAGFLSVLAALSLQASAQEKSADELAKELSNPAGSLASLNTSFVYTTYKGDLNNAGDQGALSLQFQPSLPWALGGGKRLIFRPLFPVFFDQPVYKAEENDFNDLDMNMGDISFDLVLAGTEMSTKKNGYLWGIGLAGTLPTATNNALGGDQWRAGPEVFGGVLREWGLVGALVSNQWNLGGGDGGPNSNDQPYSVMTSQYFYAYALGNGWQFAASPVITYDSKADSDNAWSVPLGAGFAKTTSLGGRPWKFAGQVHYYVEQPDQFGPEWLFKFTITPVIANKLFQ